MSVCVLGTEFGRVLEELVVVPGAAGAVLSDDRGYAIDYVRKSPHVTDVDVQLLGAQLGHVLERMSSGFQRCGLGAPVLVLESPSRALMAAPLCSAYVAALLLVRPANVAVALRRFERGCVHLARLLG